GTAACAGQDTCRRVSGVGRPAGVRPSVPARGTGHPARSRGQSPLPARGAATGGGKGGAAFPGRSAADAGAVRASMMKAQATTTVSRMLRTGMRVMFIGVSPVGSVARHQHTRKWLGGAEGR